ncbi:hypothetical protein [Pseudonocardia sp. NPDC049635]|uniref:hypothetical protein n=1 Tax=Pseudonocardia sp. NPDC049635 TaxID=3155506 RepID=UPI0033F4E7DD
MTTPLPDDAGLPGFAELLGPLAARHLEGPVQARLRWKPGVNARLGLVAGGRGLLAATFADPADTERLATRPGAVLDPAGPVVLPASSDPRLRRVPAGDVLAYNPARRIVVRTAEGVVSKRYAVAPAEGVRGLLTDPPPGLRAHLPPARVRGREVRTAWVDGRTPGPGDAAAVLAAVAALHDTSPPAGLPALDAGSVRRAARAAVTSVLRVLPAERARCARLLGLLHGAPWPTGTALLHGDLSADQTVVTTEGVMLLDLDRAAVGPVGWDAAQWSAAALACGGGLDWPGRRPEPVLSLAALLLRLPEPFRRLRPDWAERTRTLLRAADEVGARPAPASAGRARSAPRAGVGRGGPAGEPAVPAFVQLPGGARPVRGWPHRDPDDGGPAVAVEALGVDGRLLAAIVPWGDGAGPRPDGVRILDGADPRLPTLAGALAAPGTTLVGHRPGRRAVLRTADGHYLKIVRPGRAHRVRDGLATAARLLAGRPGAPVLPRICGTADADVVRLHPLPGPTLHELLARDREGAVTACEALAGACSALHGADPAGLPVHGADDEAAVLLRWCADADRFTGSDLTAPARRVAAALVSLGPRPRVPTHRDLHDKQVISLGDGRVGLLDLDTLCAADPALDDANLLAHLRLRVEQGHTDTTTARRCAAALGFPDPFRPVPVDRPDGRALAVHLAASLLRVAAVHRFRPEPPRLTGRLVAAVSTVLPAAVSTVLPAAVSTVLPAVARPRGGPGPSPDASGPVTAATAGPPGHRVDRAAPVLLDSPPWRV